MKKKIIAMLTATMCLASNSLCFSSVAIAANTQGDVEIADVKAPSSETQKSLITVDDILGLSKKAEALTWSDFEKYAHIDVGSGLIVWEFKIKDDSSKLFIGGGRLEEKPIYISLELSNGNSLDVRRDDLTSWYYDNSTSTATTAPITTTSISTTTTVSNEPVPIETEPAGHYESQYEIIIDDMPDKLVYSIGENLDLTGLRVSLFLYDQQGKKNVVYQNVDPLEYTDVFIIDTNFNNDKAGIYSIGIMTTDHYRAFLETKMQKFTVTVKNQVDMMGDVNDDGSFNVSDVVLLQKWLLAVPDTHLANWKAADFCEDNKLDVFDLCLMKRALIEQHQQRQITVDDIVSLSKKGDDLTVADFAPFKGEDIGSGLCVMKYEVIGKENQYYLLVGHDGKSDKPIYADLVNVEKDGKWDEIDIRSEEFQNVVEIYENWNKGTDTEENRASARILGDYALKMLKDGTYSLDTVIDSENASELMDEETVAIMDKYVFTDMEFLDEHTVMLHLNYGFFADCGYLITDGTVAYAPDTQVSVPDKGYDGDVINIEWADGNLYYFTAGL